MAILRSSFKKPHFLKLALHRYELFFLKTFLAPKYIYMYVTFGILPIGFGKIRKIRKMRMRRHCALYLYPNVFYGKLLWKYAILTLLRFSIFMIFFVFKKKSVFFAFLMISPNQSMHRNLTDTKITRLSIPIKCRTFWHFFATASITYYILDTTYLFFRYLILCEKMFVSHRNPLICHGDVGSKNAVMNAFSSLNW